MHYLMFLLVENIRWNIFPGSSHWMTHITYFIQVHSQLCLNGHFYLIHYSHWKRRVLHRVTKYRPPLVSALTSLVLTNSKYPEIVLQVVSQFNTLKFFRYNLNCSVTQEGPVRKLIRFKSMLGGAFVLKVVVVWLIFDQHYRFTRGSFAVEFR